MRFLADLHIHSRFSRATSRELTLPNLHAWAQRKGIFLVGTGDVTHPEWLEELADQLVPVEEGLFTLRPDLAEEAAYRVPAVCRGPVRFLLQGEVSSIYKHDGAVRKVHSVVFLSGLPGARRFLAALDRLGNVRSDGRPILGLPARDLLEVLLEADPGGRLVPAHVWTPWFSLLGSKSGYDSVEACFDDLAGEIVALETGLSSDPAMNWRVSQLDRYGLISNSDAHSPQNLGREANEFDLEPSFPALFASLRPGDPRFLGTLEFFPEEGKYHLDGHRKCSVRLTPAETAALAERCPACGGKLTVGVLHRVEELADRPAGVRPSGARSYASLVPLPEVLAECLGVGKQARRVETLSNHLRETLGPEFSVLREVPVVEIERVAGPLVGEAVRRVREGKVHIAGGYDGEFGSVRLFTAEERRHLGGQGALFREPHPRSVPPRRPLPPPAVLSQEQREPGSRAVATQEGRAGVDSSRPAEPEKDASGGGDRAAGRTLPLFATDNPLEGLLDGLNPEQRAAVTAPLGPLAIVAGPGTGKTRTLTHRIAYRIRAGGVPADRVLAVTFTNRAAEELRGRLGALLAPDQAQQVRVCTLHRLGLDLLRAEATAAGLPPDFPVLGPEESDVLLRGLAPSGASRLREEVSRVRRGARARPETGELVAAYEAALAQLGAVDLDDLVRRPVALLESDPQVRLRWQGRFRHVAVDEFQDLDPGQVRFLSLLAPEGADITVIGDPDQSIYGFRGAAPQVFAAFAAERPSTRQVRLSRNYRSTATILEASVRMLGADEGGAGLVAFLAAGPRVTLASAPTEAGEGEFVAREIEGLVGGTSHASLRAGRGDRERDGEASFADVAVLYRLRAQRPALEAALDWAGIPFRAVGEEPALLRGRGADLLRRLRGLPRETRASRAVQELLDGLGLPPDHPATGAWHTGAAGAGTVGELLDLVALRAPEDDYDPRAERVTLLTLHAAKGLEFPVVFVTGCEDGVLPHLREDEEPDLAEERRLLYVGMTRARERLYLTRAQRRTIYGRTAEARPSRFLAAIEDALVEVRSVGARKADGVPRQLGLW